MWLGHSLLQVWTTDLEGKMNEHIVERTADSVFQSQKIFYMGFEQFSWDIIPS